MNNATLEGFRQIHEAMTGAADYAEYVRDHSWQWIGQWASQRMFEITEERAKAMAARHGGTASRMKPVA